MLKKVFILVSGLFILVMPLATLAQTYGLDTTANKLGYSKSVDTTVIVGNVIAGALGLVGLLFFGVMMYAGLRWMTARGNDELKEKAIHALQAAVLGLVVVILTYALTAFILGRLAPPAPTSPDIKDTPGAPLPPAAAACVDRCREVQFECAVDCQLEEGQDLINTCRSNCLRDLDKCRSSCLAS